jgi:cytochrome c peroxidase
MSNGKLFVEDRQLFTMTLIPLPGDSRFDTGHDLFHRDAGVGIACASCHPEGGEDGHVWTFSGVGKRRTQALHVGLSATAPFHWNGDLQDIGALMDEVFVGRMGGEEQSPERIAVLTRWLDGLPRPPAIRDASEAAVARGDALFHSTDIGCAGCHTGDHFTNNGNAWVGTTSSDALLQVPSLIAVGYRAPFLHNGCAATLIDRFDPACGGGDNHGHTSTLRDTEKADLVAYLESL